MTMPEALVSFTPLPVVSPLNEQTEASFLIIRDMGPVCWSAAVDAAPPADMADAAPPDPPPTYWLDGPMLTATQLVAEMFVLTAVIASCVTLKSVSDP